MDVREASARYQLKPVFKQTEVGLIPEDWSSPSIKEIAANRPNAVVGGPFGSDLVSKNYVAIGVPVVRGQNMSAHYVSGDFAFVSKLKAKLLRANIARPCDVVFTQRGTLGQVALVPSAPFDEYIVSQSQMKLTLNSDAANAEYIYQYFISAAGQKQVLDSAIQTGVPHTNLSILRSYRVPVPSTKAEQEAIAEALSDADALIESLEQLIAKKRQIKQGAMQELLTGRKRLPRFSGKWESKTIENLEKENLLRLSRGKVISRKDIARTPGGYPIYSSSVTGNGIFGHYGDYMLDEELITWSVDGGGHFFHRPKHKFSVTNVCGFMRVDHGRLSCAFVAAQLQLLHSRLKFDYLVKAHPSVIRKAYELKVPELVEQTAIATILSDMDTELAALESKLCKARELKQGMMQELLTGRIRLPLNVAA
ncbi:MAG: restriction endonuclease subunit S [Rudaea sp.]